MTRARSIAFVVLAIVLGLPGLSQAQASLYIVDYFDNANNPAYSDATVRITNVGLVPGTGTGVGDQCALIYVWDFDQQLAECCGCRITPNGLLKLSMNNNLAGNSLTGATLSRGTIVIVPSSAPNTAAAVPAGSSAGCNPGLAPIQAAGSYTMSAWSTHIQDSGATTEGNFIAGSNNTGINADNSFAAVAALAAKCTTANILGGSGHGLCSCTDENGTAW